MLDLKSDKSIYIQIAEIIENEILLGNLKPEDQAPSTNQFAKVYQINPATVGKGLNILVDEGILYKKRGIGMFVAEGAKKQIIQKRKNAFLMEVLPSLIKEAERIEITKEDLIEFIKSVKGGD